MSTQVSMDTSCMLNYLDSMQLNSGMSLPQSLVLIQIGLRFGHIPLNYVLSWRLADQDKALFSSKWFKRFIVNDLREDNRSYRLPLG